MKRKLLPLVMACISGSVFGLDGRIVDSEGQAVSDATVEIVGKGRSVDVDAEGYFKLDSDNARELHISAPGFAHQTIHVHDADADTIKQIVLVKTAIEQVDIVGIPLHASNIESAMPVNVLAGDELRNKQAATLGDSLAGEVGIHTNFHGNVASTPIIRGLSGPRVLITQNSLDVSDVSRVGPDHGVATEVSTSERIEVLRGPATLFFGSGAIGGVVNIIDKRVPTETDTSGEWLLSYDTVNEQSLVSGNLNTGTGNVAFHVDGFWRESSDYEVPVSPELEEDHDDEHGEERTVENTAEESSGFTLGTSYILENGYIGVSYGRLDRDYGVPGHGHGDEDEDGEELEEAEEVILGLEQDRFQLVSELHFDHEFISAFNTRAGYTDYTHTEFENGEPGTTFTNETSELRVELLHQSLADWHGGFVFDYKTTEFSAAGEEAFAPASQTDTFAFGILEEKHLGDVLLQLGARFETVTVKSSDVTISDVEFHVSGEEHDDVEEEEEHEEEIFGFDERFNPFSVSVGAVWDFTPGYNVGISLSRSERAPSAAELLSFGPHIATDTFEVGALFESHLEDDEVHFEFIDAVPEMEVSNNLDLSFTKYEGNVGLIVNVFYNQVDNYYAQFDTDIVAEVGHAHGDEEDEDADEEVEELPVLIFQSDNATLHGIEAQGVWQTSKYLKTSIFTDFVKAELDEGGYLPRIPPQRLGLSFDYDYENWSANLSWISYAEQTNVAELETTTEGYNWIDAHLSYRIPLDASDLTLFIKGENLADDEARVHSSFLKDLAPRPGRNIRVGIRGTF